MTDKGTETDSDCHQLIGTLRATISLLKDELRNKQVTMDNLIDVINNFTVIENKYKRNKEQETNVGSKKKNDVVGELLEIDELHNRFQKLTDQPQSSTDSHATSINVNKDCIEQNCGELELTNNVKDNINDKINENSKSSITTNRDRSDNDNDPDIYNNTVIFDDSIPKGINIRNLNTRLRIANCKCRFFGGATSKHFHHYIQPTLNETNIKTDIVVLHMGTNSILNAKVNKDLIAESVIGIAKECVRFNVKDVLKDVFVCRVTVNTRRCSAFISAVNNILQDRCATHQFHLIYNSNIKKNTSGKMAFI